MEFDQSEFIDSENTSMDSIGYIYVPSSCQDKKKSKTNYDEEDD